GVSLISCESDLGELTGYARVALAPRDVCGRKSIAKIAGRAAPQLAGRWNIITHRCGRSPVLPPQVTWPFVTGIRPIATRSKVVLPDPFGPIRNVGAPGSIDSATWSRMVTAPATTVTRSRTMGRSEAGARMVTPRSAPRH